MAETITHWVDGKPRDGRSGRTGPVFDPATGNERGRASRSPASRRSTTPSRRPEPRSADWRRHLPDEAHPDPVRLPQSSARRAPEDELGEHHRGRARKDQAGRARRGAARPRDRRVRLRASPSCSRATALHQVSTGRRPASPCASRSGVVGCITPFNFPAMVPLWMTPIAIACGNTVVLKPSEKDPSASNRLAELWGRSRASDGCTQRGPR